MRARLKASGVDGAALLERERELYAARRSLSELAAGRGQLVVAEAAAGLGKTRLLQAIAEEAAELGAEVLTSRGSVLEREFAFGSVRQWLDQLARRDPSELEQILSGPARVVSGLLDPSSAADPAAAANTFAVLHALYWALANLCADRPVLLVLDDAHWADAASLRFVGFMQPRVHDLPLMLAVGVRPAEPGARSEIVSRLLADPAAEILRPSVLSVDGVSDLVTEWLGAPAAPEFAAACHAATGGNPFYVQMLLAELEAAGVVPEAASAALVGDIGPRNVSRALLLQLAHQPPGTIELAKALSVLGDEASPEILATVASVDDETLAAGLDALRQTTVIDPQQVRPRFVHPIVRAAVYSDMGASERAAAHARAAQVLHVSSAVEEAVAGQLMLTGPLGEPWAVESLRTAGLQASARGAPEAAIAYFARALEEPMASAARAGVFAELGRAEAQLMLDGSIEHLEAAIALGEDPHWRAEVARQLAKALGFRSLVLQAIAALERAATDAGPLDAELSLLLVNEILFYGRVDREGRQLTRERAARLCAEFASRERATTHGERIAFLNAAAEVTMRGDSADQAARLAEESLRDDLLLGEETVASPIPPAAVLILIYCDRPEPARRFVENALAEAVQSGSILGFAHYSLLRAELNLSTGALAEAEADARASLESVRVPGVKAQQVGVLVRILTERGDLAGAEEVLEQHRMAGELPNGFHVKEMLARRGGFRLVHGRAREALADLLLAGERQLAYDMPNPATLPWRSQAALAYHRLGEPGRARELAEEEVRLARAFGASRALGVALTAAGLVSDDPGAEWLEEAVTVLESSPADLDLARALILRGAQVRRRGERVTARPLLTRGLELARECGATPLVEEATQQLASAGARPRSILRRGRDALTPTELRVARLAADGHSNPEIAQAQFVTLKTVETQLGSCYRKLGIGSRRELARALEE